MATLIEQVPCAWMGSLALFLSTPEETILRELSRAQREKGMPQIFAWDRSLLNLREELRGCLPEAAEFALILEFELPRSGGRRPDLIILENGTVLVIEFKNRVEAERADIDQVLGYVRDLEQYHSACRGRTLIPILVPIGWNREEGVIERVRIVSPKGLAGIVRDYARKSRRQAADPREWALAPYEPLPALIEASRLLFERQPLPRIKTAESAKIPEVVELIEDRIRKAAGERRHLLVLLTGVPGSGKTLVGLQVAHSRALGGQAVFLTGNHPLAQVLQYSLGSREFVQEIRSYLREYLVRRPSPPRETAVIFDEAQRAWDRDRVLAKHHGDLTASEPELLMRVGQKADQGFTIVALMGEGQEIHAGEEAGIGQWAEAVAATGSWDILGPPHLKKTFQAQGLAYEAEALLNLTTSLRSHRAAEVTKWVENLLAGELDQAKEIAGRLREEGFFIYLSRNLEILKEYARDRYQADPERRYGILASSKFRKLKDWGVRPARHNYWYYGQWYENARDDPQSCCRLDLAISEFGCQGLELDLPIVCWGPDLTWEDGQWQPHVGRARLVKDPERLRFNAYRVLLTRGRDGLLIYVPQMDTLDQTNSVLLRVGARGL
jgi:hypothetical protein